MVLKQTYNTFCEDPTNNPSGTEAERIKFATLTSAISDTTTNTSKNEDQMLTQVMTDMGPATGMNGGLIVFVEAINKLGGTIQVLHNIAVHPSGDQHNVPFVFYNDVKDWAVESVTFQKYLLAKTDEVIVLDKIERLFQYFTTNETINIVGPYVAGKALTKNTTTRNTMFLPFILFPYVMGYNLTPKSAIRILVPVMHSLGLHN